MFSALSGSEVFFRLSERDRFKAEGIPGFTKFEQIPGRAIREYLVFPTAVRIDRNRSRRRVTRSLTHASGLPPKKTKSKTK
jgi:hypothetical protein